MNLKYVIEGEFEQNDGKLEKWLDLEFNRIPLNDYKEKYRSQNPSDDYCI